MEISCGIIPIHINQDGRYEFLLIQHHAGHWSFPKGHQEDQENYRETAERELFEETQLKITSYLSDNSVTDQYRLKREGRMVEKEVYYYIALVDTQEVQIQEQEVKAYFWGTKDEVLDMITFQETKNVFQKALNMIQYS